MRRKDDKKQITLKCCRFFIRNLLGLTYATYLIFRYCGVSELSSSHILIQITNKPKVFQNDELINGL